MILFVVLGPDPFEALELLSIESTTILQSMSHGNEKFFDDITIYFQINDDDDELILNSLTINDNNEHEIPTLEILSKKYTAHQAQLRSTASADKLLEVYESANQFIKEWKLMDTELDQKVNIDVTQGRSQKFSKGVPATRKKFLST